MKYKVGDEVLVPDCIVAIHKGADGSKLYEMSNDYLYHESKFIHDPTTKIKEIQNCYRKNSIEYNLVGEILSLLKGE
jgi:hypothetical protein